MSQLFFAVIYQVKVIGPQSRANFCRHVRNMGETRLHSITPKGKFKGCTLIYTWLCMYMYDYVCICNVYVRICMDMYGYVCIYVVWLIWSLYVNLSDVNVLSAFFHTRVFFNIAKPSRQDISLRFLIFMREFLQSQLEALEEPLRVSRVSKSRNVQQHPTGFHDFHVSEGGKTRDQSTFL